MVWHKIPLYREKLPIPRYGTVGYKMRKPAICDRITKKAQMQSASRPTVVTVATMTVIVDLLNDPAVLLGAVSARTERISCTAHRIGGQTTGEVIGIGTNIAEVVGGPGSISKVPTLHGRIDLGFVLFVRFSFGLSAGNRNAGDDHHGNNAQDGDYRQEF